MHHVECFAEIFKQIWQKLNMDQPRTYAMISWSIWKKRNVLMCNCGIIEMRLDQVANRSISVLQVWQQQHRHCMSAGADQPEVRMTENWTPPPISYVKCSLDAAFFVDQQCAGVGMCMSDEYGKFIVAKNKLMLRGYECS